MSAPRTPSESGTWVGLAGPGAPGLAIDPTRPVVVRKITVEGRRKPMTTRALYRTWKSLNTGQSFATWLRSTGHTYA